MPCRERARRENRNRSWQNDQDKETVVLRGLAAEVYLKYTGLKFVKKTN